MNSESIVNQLSGYARAVMLYGSYARGDSSAESDIDVMQVVFRATKPYRRGRLAISPYTAEHLKALSAQGSLFVLHLKLEGRVLSDPQGILREVLSQYRSPKSYASIKDDLRFIAKALDITSEQFQANPRGFTSLALYLLRTWLYATMAENETPMFSLPGVLTTLGRPDLIRIFDLRRSDGTKYGYFQILRQALTDVQGSRITNDFGSLEALAVAAHGANSAAEIILAGLLTGESQLNYELLGL